MLDTVEVDRPTLKDIEDRVAELDQEEDILLQKLISIRLEKKRLRDEGATHVSNKNRWIKDRFRSPVDFINIMRDMEKAEITHREIGELCDAAQSRVTHLLRHPQKSRPKRDVEPETTTDKKTESGTLRKKQNRSPLESAQSDFPFSSEAVCKTVTIPELAMPDGCLEVIEHAKLVFTTKKQWSYLHAYIEATEL